MRILFFEPSESGHRVEYINLYLNKLVELSKDQIEIGLIVPEGFNSKKLNKRIKIYRLKYSLEKKDNIIELFFFYIVALYQAITLAKQEKYQILHLLYIDTFKIPSFFLTRLFGKNLKFVYTLHWSRMESSMGNIFYLLFKKIEFYFFKQIIKDSLAVFVHGDFIKKDLIFQLKGNFSGKIISIPYPTSFAQFPYSKLKSRYQLNLPLEKTLLLAFGGTRYEKGLDILLEALGKTLNKENLVLVIAGKQVDFSRKDIELLIRKFRLKRRVILRLAFIPDKEMPHYFNACDVVVLPYRPNFFGQSGPLTQAVRFNTPVIATNVSQVGYEIKKYHLGKVLKDYKSETLKEELLKIQRLLNKKRALKLKNTTAKYMLDNSLNNMIKISSRIYNRIS